MIIVILDFSLDDIFMHISIAFTVYFCANVGFSLWENNLGLTVILCRNVIFIHSSYIWV